MLWKRVFDIIFSLILLGCLFLPLLIIWIVTSVNLKSNGFFFQTRIGQNSRKFKIYKFRTIKPNCTITTAWTRFLRRTKCDELPQLINIVKGDMSFVGPRPDIQGYYDLLEGRQKVILKLKPGLTSEAALKYFSEEDILLECESPKTYNHNVLFPDKIKMNMEYYYTRSFMLDLKIILKTGIKFFMFLKKYNK
ncbi:sugar transferase [Winogradskyella sp.]|uniref:sugar transferase n=1 Tax=Winogradskyella sp. TaxID=1883156 RepID=UPI003AB7D69A